MQKTELFGSLAAIDQSQTAAWYAASDTWGCDCGHCQNFLALARQRDLPASILQSLDALQIPPEKATYVSELHTDEAGVLYQFSYRIAGVILATSDTQPAETPTIGRLWHDPYPYGAPNFPEPHFDLEFCTVLPWILKTP